MSFGSSSVIIRWMRVKCKQRTNWREKLRMKTLSLSVYSSYSSHRLRRTVSDCWENSQTHTHTQSMKERKKCVENKQTIEKILIFHVRIMMITHERYTILAISHWEHNTKRETFFSDGGIDLMGDFICLAMHSINRCKNYDFTCVCVWQIQETPERMESHVFNRNVHLHNRTSCFIDSYYQTILSHPHFYALSQSFVCSVACSPYSLTPCLNIIVSYVVLWFFTWNCLFFRLSYFQYCFYFAFFPPLSHFGTSTFALMVSKLLLSCNTVPPHQFVRCLLFLCGCVCIVYLRWLSANSFAHLTVWLCHYHILCLLYLCLSA